MIKSIAVFCGSSRGTNPNFATQAELLGRTLAKRGIELVYGGSNVGLMCLLADGALSEGGEVTGVIPWFLRDREIAHTGLTRKIDVETMHERKQLMYDLCEGVIALPGGFGTMDELFEVITWAQLGIHSKPIAVLNIDGYYDFLTDLLRTMIDNGLLREEYRNILMIGDSIEEILTMMENYEAPCVEKWILPAHP